MFEMRKNACYCQNYKNLNSSSVGELPNVQNNAAGKELTQDKKSAKIRFIEDHYLNYKFKYLLVHDEGENIFTQFIVSIVCGNHALRELASVRS